MSCHNHLHLQSRGWMQKKSHSCSALPSFSLPSECALYPLARLLVVFIFLSFDAAIEILLACSFEWFEVLKRHSITRHFKDPEESDAIAKEDGNGDDDDYDEDDDSDEGARRTSRAGRIDRMPRRESSGEFWWIIRRRGSQSISENLSWLHSLLMSTVT